MDENLKKALEDDFQEIVKKHGNEAVLKLYTELVESLMNHWEDSDTAKFLLGSIKERYDIILKRQNPVKIYRLS